MGPQGAPASDALYRSLRNFTVPYADDRRFATEIAVTIDFLRPEPPHG